jgi:rhodanese-related sulfurtransferase
LTSAGIPGSYEEIQRISPEELKALLESGADIVVVDNQPEGAYEMGHIPGAVNFPWAMDIEGPGDLPQDRLLVLYCACMHEEDAGDVGMQLITKWGYDKVMLLEGGWLRWVELEYPVEEGE